ncbi:energy transducer TonB [Pseudohongiella spirulinae]|uniref:TonB C-terminal domain-containing protein n=1 Tax=Pseudohongiella spirulinae TaxID=1249552 RepID=A0A0S2KET3_9GAMM|nr:hypothetical protein [Pseudohongiella spirulinae]ALO46745.1 hypothetical protein PS2015_2106 [Pseudohongiella spirulinae]
MRNVSLKSAALIAALCTGITLGEAAEDNRQELSERVEKLNQLRAELQSLQETEGTYSNALLPLYAQLTEALIDARAYDEALEVLEQHQQLIKIHEGLHAEAQIDVVLKQLEVLASSGLWDSLYDRLSHLEWIQQRASDRNLEQRVDGLKQLSGWVQVLLQQGPRNEEWRYLLRLRDLESQSYKLVDDNATDADKELLDQLQYDLAQSELYIALAMATPGETSRLLINHELNLQTSAFTPPRQMVSVSDVERAYGARASSVIERAHRTAMNRHYSLIKEIAGRQDNDPLTQATMEIYLGDSVLLRQQYELRPLGNSGPTRGSSNIGSAGSHYDEAWQLFLEAGITESQLNAFFACPMLLPMPSLTTRLGFDNPPCTQLADGTIELPEVLVTEDRSPGLIYHNLEQTRSNSTLEGVRVQVSFTVGVNGQASRIQSTSAEPDTVSVRIRGRDALQQMQFRPALENGRSKRQQNVRITMISLNAD